MYIILFRIAFFVPLTFIKLLPNSSHSNNVLIKKYSQLVNIFVAVMYFWTLLCNKQGFPGDISGKGPTCQCKRHKRGRFDPWVGKIPWRTAWQPTLIFLPGESHRQGSLLGYNPQGGKELDMTEATEHACMLGIQVISHF